MLPLPDYEPIEAFLVGRCGKSEREAALTSFWEYMLRAKGLERELQERMEVARWICFQMYSQNPYVRPPRAKSPQSFLRLPWEEPTEDEVEQAATDCIVSADEAAELDKIFAELRKKRESQDNG